METNNPGLLSTKIATFKIIARDALRMNLISPRLSLIASLQNEVNSLTKDKGNYDHQIVVNNYEISKLDVDHPDYEVKKTNKLNRIKEDTESSENIAKTIVEVQKQIDEEKVGITKIESGETKVSLDDLNAMVTELIKADAIKQVNAA